MKVTKIACLTLVAVTLAAAPSICRADDTTNAPAATTPAPKKHGQGFHGKVASVDAAAMTFTVGKTTVTVTSTTKITKDGKPAVFSDITVGESVSGGYKKDDQGNTTATSVKIKAAAAAAQ